MKLRTRCARFSACVKDRQWIFVWNPKTRCLIAKPLRARKNKILAVTAEHLVELLQGQLMLL